MTIQPVATRVAPGPAGHYSQAVVAGGLVLVFGIVQVFTAF
jgi:hypothetical protein